ncbi:MAG: tetratricopeptide repeat protein [Alphaproteobacteria bacterium]|nr:tetratricopeptide repeat protein [Alphaproteobacteria bacterium]
MATVADALKDGLAHHNAGRLKEAEAEYRRILAASPDHADANHLLGVIAHQRGDHRVGIALIEKALAHRPKVAVFHRNLGTALLAAGEAIRAAEAHRTALALQPDFAEAHHSLAEALRVLEKPQEAEAHYRRALVLKPGFAFARNGLGLALAAQGRYAEAEAEYRAALAETPAFAQAVINLAQALELRNRPREAETEYRKALKLDPTSLAALVNWGNLCKEGGRTTEAMDLYRRALQHHPNAAPALNNLANLLKDQGMVEEALALFRRAIAIEPKFGHAHSNLLLTMHYVPGPSPEEIVAAHREWAARFPTPDAAHANSRDPERRLRVGYVSPDFRRHPVASFIEPILAAHDRHRVEVFCYAVHLKPDAVTARLKALADHWREIGPLDTEAAANLIRADGIDVLVDLAGHTANNRLAVFARKPAPVQATYLGYPGTTGLPAMDWRITDAVADPPGDAEMLHTEALMRLPETFQCFGKPPDAPAVEPVPMIKTGHVTFASFNMLAKVHPALISRWAKILRGIEGARLVLKSAPFRDAGTRAHYHAMFAAHGIAAERVDLLGYIPSAAAHFTLYNRIDVALDTDPYNGATTTCEALWMGVPVVTLAGRSHVGRVGAAILTHLGLEELIAASPEDYVARAVTLARDPARLSALRTSLRPRMETSSLTNPARFTAALEDAYGVMWRQWCAKTA